MAGRISCKLLLYDESCSRELDRAESSLVDHLDIQGEKVSPFAVVSFGDEDSTRSAKLLMARSILAASIHELWGKGEDYPKLHENVKKDSSPWWPRYKSDTFRFDVDSYRGSRSSTLKRDIIESFAYMNFDGRIIMRQPDCTFTVFEDFEFKASEPHMLYLGRLIAESGRKVMNKYNLKKRRYIATTSMDAELSLITANIAQAAPGKLAYDPFMGTGSFPLACACFGALTFGSDLDGRSIRGKGTKTVASNFVQYDTSSLYLGGFAADITNTPLVTRRMLDVIVCDPPYGVREGLKVLGHVKERLRSEIFLADGTSAYLQPDYVPPRRPYSFVRMLDDILDFAAARLVDNGRLCMWMPVAGSADSDAQNEAKPEEVYEYPVPQHPCLQLDSVCQQDFNKWSRRLITYRRRCEAEVDQNALAEYQERRAVLLQGGTSTLIGDANDLNDFRKKYFQGFKE
ncbi:hypothetical protein AMS68_007672 [Peltaster fructicola]|uniref:tRNA (guanine(10)-N(2))-methyltransferase n=1 Tax=Peltaster fructicola TaxID=286661 RepID=A0A6H0Y5H5_9PEZI|nr:hypothetical protein AMS68_007672 [Peltaster fructicola]